MDNFVPKKPPIAQRLRKNTAFRFLVVIGILFFCGSALLDWRSSRPVEEDDFVIIKPTQKQAKKQAAIAESSVAENIEEADEKEEVEAAKPIAIAYEAVMEDRPMRLSTSYQLVSSDGMEALLSRSIAQDSRGEISSGIIPSVQKLSDIKKFVEMEPVGGAGTRDLVTNKNIIADSSARKIEGLDEYAGLRLIIVPSRIQENEVVFSVNITGNFFDPQSDEAPSENEVRAYNTTFRLGESEIGFVSGFLPHTPPKVTESDVFFTQGPLSVFKNELFIENAAEFVIFFTVDGLENKL